MNKHAVKVEKNIPAYAGLGGGSSDAATFLKMCNSSLNLELSLDELASIGLKVGADVASQIENGSKSIFGVMIESHLNEGNQEVGPLSSLKYGVSITDSCIGWNDTEELLRALAKSVKIRNN